MPLGQKLEKLPDLALFWFSSDSPYGGIDWGFAVDVTDLARILLLAGLFGAYFALLARRRETASRARVGAASATARGGVAGMLTSVVGLSTGPCSVMGCGAPVIPVVGLAFAGLSSGTLAFLASLSRVDDDAGFPRRSRRPSSTSPGGPASRAARPLGRQQDEGQPAERQRDHRGRSRP